MAFDLSTARPESTFDLSTAKRDPRLDLQDLLVRQSKGEQGLQPLITQMRRELNIPDTSADVSGSQPIQRETPASANPISAAITEGAGFPVGESIVSGARGIKQGALNIGQGVLGLAGKAGLLSDEFNQNLELSRNIEQERTKQITQGAEGSALVGEIIGEALALPLPITKAATIPRTIAKTVAINAPAGAISAEGRGQDPLEGALIAAGFSAGLQSLTSAGQALGRRLINAKSGNFKSDDVKELIETAKREGIELFGDDASKNIALQKLSVFAEDVPFFGTRAGRLRQSKQQTEAAQRLAENLSGDLDDFAFEAQSGLKRRLNRVKKIVGNKFRVVTNSLNKFGNIDKTGFRQTIQDEIENELAKGSRANQSLIDVMESFKNAPEGNFGVIRSQRSDLGDEISEFFKGDNKLIGAKGVDKLQRIKIALETDIDKFVKINGAQKDIAAFRSANKFTIDNLIPFKESQLANLTGRKAEPEKILAFLRTSKGQTRPNLLFRSLDSRGRQAVKASIIADALDKATTGRKAFSANTFAGELEKAQNVTNVFFKGKDKEQLNGFVKLMRATARAGQVAENPPTGVRLLLPGAVVGAASDLGTTATVAASFGLINKFFQTKIGRNLLIALNKTTENTKEFERITSLINQALIRASITTSLNGGQ